MHFWRARALFAAAAAAVVIAAAPSSASAQYDYTVGNVTAPAAADAGATITMTAIETAAPTSPAARYPWVRFFLAADAGMTSMVTELCTTWPSLAPGASGPVSCTVQLPTWSPGTYYLGAVIDPEGFIAETDEQNNRSPAAAPIQIVFHRPDFTVSQVTAPSSADAGAAITLSAVESSAAGASIPSYPARVGFYLATDAALTNRIAELCMPYPPLGSGTSQTVTCAATISAQVASGTYYVGAVIDPENLAAESDEQNNSSPTVPIQITHRPPDFSLAQLSSPTNATAGAPVELTVLESSAAGASGAVHAPWVTFYLARDAALQDPVTELCTTWPQLGTGTSRTVTCAAQLPPTLGAGTYYFGAVIDPRNQYVETDEANNLVAGGAIPVGPDLVVAGLTAPDAVADAAWITVVDTVTNRGSSAGPFSVGFFLSSDAAITSSDLLLGTRVVTDLAAGGTSASATQLQIPAGLSGRVYLGAIVDTSLQVAEADEENNASPAIAMDVIADSTPPRIAVTGITDGEITSARPLGVCYTATDPFLVSDEGVLDGIPFRGCASAWSEGMHSLAVTATDLAGHVTTAEVHFIIDTTAPTLTAVAPTSGALTATTVHVVVAASDTWGIAAVSAGPASLARGLDGAYRGSLALAPGPRIVVVTAADLAGNRMSVDIPVYVQGTTPLALAVTSPTQGFLATSTAVSVQGRVSGGVPPLAVFVDGAALSVALDGAFATMAAAPAGTGGITVEARDAAGVTVMQVLTGARLDPVIQTITSATASRAPPGAMHYLYDASGYLTTVVDTSRDIENCGQLGRRCPVVTTGETTCVAGSCGAVSGGQFVDVSSDPAHCGPSLLACLVPANGAAACTQGLCGVSCEPGFVPSEFQCVDLATDPSHCGRVDHACTDQDAECVQGRCRVPGTPVVYAVNGVVAPGVALRSSLWTGITIEGAGLDNVLDVVLEDWGPDSSGTGIAAPAYAGLGASPHFSSSPTSLVIPQAALQLATFYGPLGEAPFQLREWHKLRLFYFDEFGTWSELLVEVPVSLDDQVPADRPPPVITGVSVLQTLALPWAYDPVTGFLRLRGPEFPECGMDPTLGPAPTAVLSQDAVPTEYPVYEVTHEGVYLQAGIQGAVGGNIPDESNDTSLVTLVFPYVGDWSDPVLLASAVYPSALNCTYSWDWRAGAPATIQQTGGLILRGSNLLADGSIALSDGEGHGMAGALSTQLFLDDRIVIRTGHGAPPMASSWMVGPPAITGVQRTKAFVEVSSPRGSAPTPRPVEWLDAPVIDSVGPQPFVTYDQVMVLTGRFLSRVSEVAFTWGGLVEQLTRADSSPPGPGQFHVRSENHIELLLPSRGGVVPRELAASCIHGGGFVRDVFPGTRSFTVRNSAGADGVTISAVDPGGTPVVVPEPACPPHPRGESSSSSQPPVPPPISPPPPFPIRPGGDCTNSDGCFGQ